MVSQVTQDDYSQTLGVKSGFTKMSPAIEGDKHVMGKINVAIIGVGNCASSLVQGIHYYKKAKEGEDTKDIPVLILSAKAAQWDRDTGLELGAEDYITKPFDRVKFLSKIKKILAKKKS